jgi:hypothetical protein
MNRAAELDALVVAAADDFPIEHQYRTDGNAARGQAFLRFVNRRLEKWIHAKGFFKELRFGKPHQLRIVN